MKQFLRAEKESTYDRKQLGQNIRGQLEGQYVE